MASAEHHGPAARRQAILRDNLAARAHPGSFPFAVLGPIWRRARRSLPVSVPGRGLSENRTMGWVMLEIRTCGTVFHSPATCPKMGWAARPTDAAESVPCLAMAYFLVEIRPWYALGLTPQASATGGLPQSYAAPCHPPDCRWSTCDKSGGQAQSVADDGTVGLEFAPARHQMPGPAPLRIGTRPISFFDSCEMEPITGLASPPNAMASCSVNRRKSPPPKTEQLLDCRRACNDLYFGGALTQVRLSIYV